MTITAPAIASLGGSVMDALEEVNVPCYMVDRFGIIRWLNPAARRLVGDARGRQFTSVVAPHDTPEAREVFARKVFGNGGATDKQVELVAPDGGRIACEVSGAPLREGGHVVGVFGLITQHHAATTPPDHVHLTPRQVQILRLLAHGHSTAQIAAELHLALETVRNHVRHALRALGVHSRLEAIAVARRDGILAN